MGLLNITKNGSVIFLDHIAELMHVTLDTLLVFEFLPDVSHNEKGTYS